MATKLKRIIAEVYVGTPIQRGTVRALEAKGIRCYRDEKKILPGDDVYEAVAAAIQDWDKLLLCCSKSSLQSWWVDKEIGMAFEKEQALSHANQRTVRTLIPLNMDDYLFSEEWKSGFRAEIRRRLAADFRQWRRSKAKFASGVDRVVEALAQREQVQ